MEAAENLEIVLQHNSGRVQHSSLYRFISQGLSDELLRGFNIEEEKKSDRAAFYIRKGSTNEVLIPRFPEIGKVVSSDTHLTVDKSFSGTEGLNMTHFTQRHNLEDGKVVVFHMYFNTEGQVTSKHLRIDSPDGHSRDMKISADVLDCTNHNSRDFRILLRKVLEAKAALLKRLIDEAAEIQNRWSEIINGSRSIEILKQIYSEMSAKVSSINSLLDRNKDVRHRRMKEILDVIEKKSSLLKEGNHAEEVYEVEKTGVKTHVKEGQAEKAFGFTFKNTESIALVRTLFKIKRQYEKSKELHEKYQLQQDIRDIIVQLYFILPESRESKEKLEEIYNDTNNLPDITHSFTVLLCKGDVEGLSKLFPLVHPVLTADKLYQMLHLAIIAPKEEGNQEGVIACLEFLREKSNLYSACLQGAQGTISPFIPPESTQIPTPAVIAACSEKHNLVETLIRHGLNPGSSAMLHGRVPITLGQVLGTFENHNYFPIINEYVPLNELVMVEVPQVTTPTAIGIPVETLNRSLLANMANHQDNLGLITRIAEKTPIEILLRSLLDIYERAKMNYNFMACSIENGIYSVSQEDYMKKYLDIMRQMNNTNYVNSCLFLVLPKAGKQGKGLHDAIHRILEILETKIKNLTPSILKNLVNNRIIYLLEMSKCENIEKDDARNVFNNYLEIVVLLTSAHGATADEGALLTNKRRLMQACFLFAKCTRGIDLTNPAECPRSINGASIHLAINSGKLIAENTSITSRYPEVAKILREDKLYREVKDTEEKRRRGEQLQRAEEPQNRDSKRDPSPTGSRSQKSIEDEAHNKHIRRKPR